MGSFAVLGKAPYVLKAHEKKRSGIPYQKGKGLLIGTPFNPSCSPVPCFAIKIGLPISYCLSLNSFRKEK